MEKTKDVKDIIFNASMDETIALLETIDQGHMEEINKVIMDNKLSEAQKSQLIYELVLKSMDSTQKDAFFQPKSADAQQISADAQDYDEEDDDESVAKLSSGYNKNGSKANGEWAKPIISVRSKDVQRKDHGFENSKITKTEYQDGKLLLNSKIDLMA